VKDLLQKSPPERVRGTDLAAAGAVGAATRPLGESTFQHKLEQFNPGIVWLDADRRVTAMNDVAIQVLRPAAEPSTC
jgi:hypothetical protein